MNEISTGTFAEMEYIGLALMADWSVQMVPPTVQ
jgi:hypothetical protein